MKLEEHMQLLGGLVGNFQTLEFVLRVFLNRLPGARPIGVPHGTNIYISPVGAELPESDLTSYDAIGLLIDKFNDEMQKRGLPRLERSLVDLRDALAHGRVSTDETEAPMRLLKFDKPKNGLVKVTFNEEMSEQWFKENIRCVSAAIRLVVAQARS